MGNDLPSPPQGRRRDPSRTKQDLLEQATQLFEESGFATPVRVLLERAQMQPPTLYRYFTDKDGLIVAVVEQWTVDWQVWMDQVLRRRGSPQDRVARLFRELERWLEAHQWRGSLAANAAAEIADPNHPVHVVIANHRKQVRERLRVLAEEAGMADSSDAARRLQVLLDGAMAGARMEQGPGPVRAARDAARLVLTGD